MKAFLFTFTKNRITRSFHQFCSGDTIEWFEKHGVELKIEADGRMFPVSNSSQTIIDCFLKATQKLGITVLTGI